MFIHVYPEVAGFQMNTRFKFQVPALISCQPRLGTVARRCGLGETLLFKAARGCSGRTGFGILA